MNRLIKQVTQVLKTLRDRIEAEINTLKAKRSDDTVEAQAHTFRIWMWASAAGLSLVVIASVVSKKPNVEFGATSVADPQVAMLDALPDGFVIAPIEPTNADSLDSIFGQHGYADLYRPTSSGEKGQRIARSLPLVRAPKNPRRFAVLVAESEIEVLGRLNEPVLVILRKGPAKNKDETAGYKRKSGKSQYKEAKQKIEVIEEDIPEYAETQGAKS